MARIARAASHAEDKEPPPALTGLDDELDYRVNRIAI